MDSLWMEVDLAVFVTVSVGRVRCKAAAEVPPLLSCAEQQAQSVLGIFMCVCVWVCVPQACLSAML